jgi:hypothetical protein
LTAGFKGKTGEVPGKVRGDGFMGRDFSAVEVFESAAHIAL